MLCVVCEGRGGCEIDTGLYKKMLNKSQSRNNCVVWNPPRVFVLLVFSLPGLMLLDTLSTQLGSGGLGSISHSASQTFTLDYESQ